MSEAIPGLDPSDVGPSDPALAHNPAFIGLLAGSYESLVGESLAPAGLGSAESCSDSRVHRESSR